MNIRNPFNPNPHPHCLLNFEDSNSCHRALLFSSASCLGSAKLPLSCTTTTPNPTPLVHSRELAIAIVISFNPATSQHIQTTMAKLAGHRLLCILVGTTTSTTPLYTTTVLCPQILIVPSRSASRSSPESATRTRYVNPAISVKAGC